MHKLECLVDVQQTIIQCIDRHRRGAQHIEEKDVETGVVQDDEMSIESLDYGSDPSEGGDSRKNIVRTRSHGIFEEDDEDEDDDDAVSLMSYESMASEYWTQSSQQQPRSPLKSKGGGNKKSKQLLIASDDVLPLMSYFVVQSQIESVNAEMAFMNDFMSDDEKQKKAGFYLTTLQAATSALMGKKLPVSQ